MPGRINDPDVKVWVTGAHLCFIVLIWEYMDPSLSNEEREAAKNLTATAGVDYNLPLFGVCEARAYGSLGYLAFGVLTALSLAFVIFGTSAQSLSGLKAALGMPETMDVIDYRTSGADGQIPHTEGGKKRHRKVRNASPIDTLGRGVPMPPMDPVMDRLKGQCCLFGAFSALIWLMVLFFTFVPFYSAGMERNMTLVYAACPDF